MALKFLNDGYFAGKVGIGTESPSYKFTAYGSSVDSEIVASFGSANDQNEYTAIGLSGFIASNGATKAGLALKRTATYGTGELHFLNNNTLDNSDMTLSDSKMMINSSGNVGIGTTSPSNPLTVVGVDSIGIDDYILHNGDSNTKFGFPSNDTFKIRTSGVDRLNINSSGNVGIGTTSPGGKLEVDGTYGDLKIGDPSVGTQITYYDTTRILMNSTDIKFFTNSLTERMTIKSNGNVGIGTTSPNVLLDVWGATPTIRAVGTSASNPSLTLSSVGITAWSQTVSGSDSSLSFNKDGSEKMRIDTSGNVGIGTDSPGAKLEVNGGEIRTTRENVSANYLSLSTTSAGSFIKNAGGTGKGLTLDNVSATSPYINFKLLSSEKMRITSSGNVGIGTTSPAEKLHVFGGAAAVKIDSTTNEASLKYTNSTTTANIKLANNDLKTELGGAERMRILANGNVGIGTTSPAAGLQVSKGGTTIPTAGSSTASAVFGNSTSDDNYGIAIGANSSGVGYISSQRTDGTATTYNLAIQPNGGNVGLGTASPGEKLEVNGRIKVQTSSGSLTLKELGSSSATIAGSATVGIEAAGNFRVKTNVSNEAFTVLSTGNVGIGNTSPTAKLHVAGTGLFTGLVSGITPVNAANFVTKAYVDGSGGGTGPFLPLAGGTMTAGAVVTFLASSGSTDDRLKFGASGQMQLFHDGSDGYIINSLGDVRMDVNTFRVRSSSGTETMIKATQNDNVELYFNDVRKIRTTSGGVFVEGEIKIDSALLDNQENTDVDTGTETVASVAIATYTAAFFDFVIKKTTNVRSGTVYACHDGTNVEFTETSTQDLGDTSDVTLSVDISGGNMRLRATTTSDNWSIKSLIRAI